LTKHIPAEARVLTHALVANFTGQLGDLVGAAALSEVRQQNRDLIDALEAVRAKQEELVVLSEALGQANRDMAALNLQLDEKATALVKSDMKKDEFLAILSHELRGPLGAARMAADLLTVAPVSADRAKQLGSLVGRQVSHMSRLVEDLLDVSRVSRGLILLDRKRVDMRAVIKDAIEQVGSFASLKKHALTSTVPEYSCTVLGDYPRLVQVISNLLSNAVRYTPEGGRISIEAVADPEHVCVKVTDNGIGLNVDDIPHLFDIYVQAERSTERSNGGLGLGLALVKSLVQGHDGTVTAENRSGAPGSIFSVTFPYSRRESSDDVNESLYEM
jgi:signal transduction histidine kinase